VNLKFSGRFTEVTYAPPLQISTPGVADVGGRRLRLDRSPSDAAEFDSVGRGRYPCPS
jgi:hypothetical protein